jgi:hypothetical protein
MHTKSSATICQMESVLTTARRMQEVFWDAGIDTVDVDDAMYPTYNAPTSALRFQALINGCRITVDFAEDVKALTSKEYKHAGGWPLITVALVHSTDEPWYIPAATVVLHCQMLARLAPPAAASYSSAAKNRR